MKRAFNCIIRATALCQLTLLLSTGASAQWSQAGSALQEETKQSTSELKLAIKFLDERKFSETIARTKNLLNDKNLGSVAKQVYGLALFRSGNKQASLPFLRAAYLEQPQGKGIAESYFDVLVACGKAKEAVVPGLLMIAIESPRNGRAQTVRRKLRGILTQVPDSQLKQSINEVAKLLPEGSSLCSYYLLLAHLCDRAGKRLLAINCYVPGLAVEPENAGEYIRYARDLEMFAAEPRLIESQYQKALRMEPDDPQIGVAYRRYLARKEAQAHDIASSIKIELNKFVYR